MATADPLFDAAVRLHRGGNLTEARRLYEQILASDPRRADVLNLLGVVSRQTGQWSAAIEYLEQAVAIDRSQAVYFGNLAEAHRALGELEPCIACYREAGRLAPHIAEIPSNLGVLLQQVGRLEEARASYAEALRIDSRYPPVHYNLGNLHTAERQWDEAIACYRQALEFAPDYVEAQCNLGNALWEKGAFDEALAWLESVFRLRPDYVPAISNLGCVLQSLGRFDEARLAFDRALALAPGTSQLLLNYGTLLKDMGDPAGAVAWYDRVLHASPNDPQALTSRATALLACGDFAAGWAAYENRVGCPQYSVQSFPQPRWDGSRLEGRTLLVHCEQGFGDTFQFIRYIGLARNRAAGHVVVAAQAPLVPLLESSGVPNLTAAGAALPPFDVHCPLLSLPHVLGTRLDTIPADVPYLAADPDRVRHWQARLAAYPGFRVGIVWQGRPEYRGDRLRSIPLSCFAPLADVQGVRLVSLQKGFGSEQLVELAEKRGSESGFEVVDLGPSFDEDGGAFMDTAAVMKSVDLVVTSDTAAAHLAGGLGVPVWVALNRSPEWRWMMDRDDSPWYPTMRLFRQREAGDWADVFARMAGELRIVAGGATR